MNAELCNIESKAELLKLFKQIDSTIVECDELPYLHFEMHSFIGKDEMVLKTGEIIRWNETSYEQERVFIVETKLFDFSNMIHRAKFYAFHRFNTMVRKGKYRFNDLKKVYTISILAGRTYGTNLYHQIGTLKNQNGELMDDQITHVVVEAECRPLEPKLSLAMRNFLTS